jgi:hypothetical protein
MARASVTIFANRAAPSNHPMPDMSTLERIREFWTHAAREQGQVPAASCSDHTVVGLEVRAISEVIEQIRRRLAAFPGHPPAFPAVSTGRCHRFARALQAYLLSRDTRPEAFVESGARRC